MEEMVISSRVSGESLMVTHVVKSWPEFFIPILAGSRRHELRLNDRGYNIGDELLLCEYDPKTEQYSGRQLTVKITSVTSAQIPCAVSNQALDKRFIILSIQK